MSRLNAHKKNVTEDGLSNLAYTLEGDGPQIRQLYTWLHVRLDGRLLCVNTALDEGNRNEAATKIMF